MGDSICYAGSARDSRILRGSGSCKGRGEEKSEVLVLVRVHIHIASDNNRDKRYELKQRKPDLFPRAT